MTTRVTISLPDYLQEFVDAEIAARGPLTRAEFVEITSAGMRESHVHDVQIVKEAPNYRVE